MSEIQTTDWDETAASNNQAAPNGAPEGMAPSGVNDTIRELMAQIKRFHNRIHGRTDAGAILSSAGSGATRTLTFDTAPATLFTGLIVSFKANSDFDANSTLNVNALGAKNIQKATTSGIVNIIAGDIELNQHVLLKYDGTLDKWLMMSPTATAESSTGTVTSVATAGIATGGPITTTGTVTVSVTAQMAETAPATGDEALIYDVSAAAHRKMTLANLFTILNALTEDTAPDPDADYVLTYDTSAAAARKALPYRLGSLAFLTSGTASASATLDFVLTSYIAAGWLDFLFVLDHVLPATDGVDLYMRTSTDGGSTFDAGANAYVYMQADGRTETGTVVGATGNSATFIALNDTGIGIGNVANEGWSGEVKIINPVGTGHLRALWRGIYQSAASVYAGPLGMAARDAAGDVDAVRFLMSSGNIASGTIRMYGIK